MLRSLLLVLLGISLAVNADGHLDSDQIGVIRCVLHTVVRSTGVTVVATETGTPVEGLEHFENLSGGLTLAAREDGERDIVVSPELWRSFRKENSEPSALAVLPAVSEVLMASPEQLKLLIPDASPESWEHFHAEWPLVRAIVRLTRPAIASNGQTALIYVTVTRGRLDAEGSLVVLERKTGGWAVKSRYVVIAS